MAVSLPVSNMRSIDLVGISILAIVFYMTTPVAMDLESTAILTTSTPPIYPDPFPIDNLVTEQNVSFEIVTPPIWQPPPWFLDLIYFFDLSATNRFLSVDVTKYICGTEYICNKTFPPERGYCTAECHPCQCDEMCHFYGDCCPDLVFAESPDIPSSPFPYVSCSEGSWTKWVNFSYILMVRTCPQGSKADEVAKCENSDIGDQTEATPVSVLKSNITYKNMYCANCHGVTDFKLWTHRVTCPVTVDLTNAKTKSELWRLILSNGGCDIVSHPPDGILPRQCLKAEVDTCNATGDQKKLPEPVIETLCHAYNHTFDYYGSDAFFTRYKNPFCAVCNGATFNKLSSCERMLSPNVPFPLNTLLDFNPTPEDKRAQLQETECGGDKAFDPFSMSCRSIACSTRRILVDGGCEDKFKSASFTGVLLRTILQPAKPSEAILQTDFTNQYFSMLKGNLKDFEPVLIASLRLEFFADDSTNVHRNWTIRKVNVEGQVVAKTSKSLSEMENVLRDILSRDFINDVQGDEIPLTSTPVFCSQSNETQQQPVHVATTLIRTTPGEVFSECVNKSCEQYMLFEPLELQCPFIEYRISEENFTFDSAQAYLSYSVFSFTLEEGSFRRCGDTLQVCLHVISNITEAINVTQHAPAKKDDPRSEALAIVSLVFISLSLAGLILTFLTYSFVPKLRTLPGKNTMGLVFHLFWAQILFITTSNRTADVVMCQVFGVLVHYFWLSSFTWMFVSAFHMHVVFTNLQPLSRDKTSDTKRMVAYSVVGVAFPLCIIAGCFSMHFALSQGTDIGYGGRICFLNNPTAIGAFFAAPLGLILFLNAIFFTRTIMAIRAVPDMKGVSNKTNQHHAIVYIKLSLLFGFTWIFGIIAEIFRSDVFSYLFTILTGSQGVMLFLAYCVNKRTWDLIKEILWNETKSSALRSASGGHNVYTSSTRTTSATE